MFSEKRPKLGDSVIYWTNGDNPEDPCIPNHAVVCNVAKEGNFPSRPDLFLSVFLKTDCKPRPRMSVQCVIDDGGITHFAGKYSMPGDYDNDETA